MLAAADVQMEELTAHALDRSNSHIPRHTIAENPTMCVLQVKAAFDAHDIAVAKQGKWMVCALRGATTRHWFLECK